VEKVVAIITAIEPILISGIGLLAMIIVPLLVKAIFDKLTLEQQRFVYDIAKGVVKGLDLIDDKTGTKLDDALLDVAKQVEDQIGRKLKQREKQAVTNAVLAARRKTKLP
jgi:hypothetical protein